MMLVAVVVVAASSGGASDALSGTASQPGGEEPPAAPACTAGNLMTFENNNQYPIFLGEFAGNPADIVVPPQGWDMGSGSKVSLCIPPPFPSGRFWARTECDFEDLYQSGPATGSTRQNSFTTCNQDTDCASLIGTTGNTYDCLGGVCMVDCSSISSDKAAAFCQGQMGIPGNTDALCSNNTGGSFDVCTYGAGVVCKTGDCNGLYQCGGIWTNGGTQTSTSATGLAPATLFEPTSTSAQVVNYDISNVSGYNTEIRVKVTPQLAANLGVPNNCYEPKCVIDLNQSCPQNLEVTEAPTAAGPIDCGGGSGLFCQSGACEPCSAPGAQSCDVNNEMTCVIGCNDPGDQCAAASSTIQSLLGCNISVANPGVTPIFDKSTYDDMYQASNQSLKVDTDKSHKGTAMSSQNQGNPTCWTDPSFADADIDCTPDQVCDTTDFSTLGFPAGVGVCVYKKKDTPPGDTGGLAAQTNCTSTSDKGAACGGYSNYPSALGYTCQQVTITAGNHNSSTFACLPAFGTGTVAGLGEYETITSGSGAPLYTGSGSEMNPEWLAAAQWAAGNGTTAGPRAFYEYFSKACPHAYGWTYDDNAGGLACNTTPPAGNKQNVNITIKFGPEEETPSPTATATATASPTATATASSTATPTASSTATATATGSATASATATITATATTTATSTASPTPTTTASPSSTATPRCLPDAFLTTNPAGTLPFGVVTVGNSSTASLVVTNNEPAGALTLSTKIKNRNAEDFALIGGSCTTIAKLKAGDTCKYKLKFTPRQQDLGLGVSTDFVITGRFNSGVCPAGDIQGATVTLAGTVPASSPQSDDAR
jgi:Thaumatin family